MLAAEFLDLLDEQMRKLVAKFGKGPEHLHRGEKPHDVPPVRAHAKPATLPTFLRARTAPYPPTHLPTRTRSPLPTHLPTSK